jgi:hypothetical protein
VTQELQEIKNPHISVRVSSYLVLTALVKPVKLAEKPGIAQMLLQENLVGKPQI